MPHSGRIRDQSVLRAGLDFSVKRKALGKHLRPETFQRRRYQAAKREQCSLQLKPASLDLGEIKNIIDDVQ